jgi:hypothetical protein
MELIVRFHVVLLWQVKELRLRCVLPPRQSGCWFLQAGVAWMSAR